MHANTISASIPSNALSSPICHSLQPYQLAQGGSLSSNIMSSGNGNRNTEIGYLNNHNRDANPSNSSDSMDMHAESSGHDFSYWCWWYCWNRGHERGLLKSLVICVVREDEIWCGYYFILLCIVWASLNMWNHRRYWGKYSADILSDCSKHRLYNERFLVILLWYTVWYL